MKYFTPDLYHRFNSSDDAVADAAYQEWETVTARYAQSLEQFRDRLPSQVRKLTELSLHDALILSRGEQIQAGGPPLPPEILHRDEFYHFRYFVPHWTAICVVTVKDDDVIRSLIYCLRDGMQVRQHRDWPFSKEGEHWLYDELEVFHSERWPMFPGGYIHRILLSSGVELEIPFTTVFVHEFSLAKISEEVME